MPSYSAPLQDMRFLLTELWPIQTWLSTIPHYKDTDPELLMTVLEEAAKFCQQELLPLNETGDQEGCLYQQNSVKTPHGFKEAYQHLVNAGWLALHSDPEFGGQGLPKILQVFFDEILASCNVAFSLYTVLTQGVYQAIKLYAPVWIHTAYLPKLANGAWSGTMCLTESHCGSDLGLLKTKAVPNTDGSYALSGTKIFITSGEHDLTENIIHAVLARLPDAPPGIKGISFFIVPKFLVNEDGSLGKRNPVYCSSIEHKMGIKGSCTCVLNFEEATGYLIGNPNEGLKSMFAMMNLERLNIGLEGLGLAEIAYQNARQYAKERLQGRSPFGPILPEKPADPIIVHPDIRRMLLTIRAFTEGARALAGWVALQIDIANLHPDKTARSQADQLVALLTPVIKAYFTDKGFDACNLALQVFGGYGYIRESGMEQYVRDARIAQIYEGTNGIQALDLVKRKLVSNNGTSLNLLAAYITTFIHENTDNHALTPFLSALANNVEILVNTSNWIISEAKNDPAVAGAVAADYLHLMALVVFAFLWAQMASIAQVKSNETFYRSKLHIAQFFFQHILPLTDALKQSIMAGSDAVVKIAVDEF